MSIEFKAFLQSPTSGQVFQICVQQYSEYPKGYSADLNVSRIKKKFWTTEQSLIYHKTFNHRVDAVEAAEQLIESFETNPIFKYAPNENTTTNNN